MKLEDLFEWDRYKLEVGDYTLVEEEDVEEDNRKIFHTVFKGGERLGGLDHSPYEYISKDSFERYIRFYEQNGRFPSRQDTGKNGPLHNEDLRQMIP